MRWWTMSSVICSTSLFRATTRSRLAVEVIESEAWAECAAVAAETRRVDTSTVDTEYHCYDDELTTYVDVVGDLTEVCAEWVGECRQFG